MLVDLLEVTATDGRVEIALTNRERDRLERAAASTGEPLAAFVRRAALDLADELLRDRGTVLPPDYLDRLMTPLDPGNA